MNKLEKKLADFAKKNKLTTRGPICVALVVTRHAQKLGLPLNPENLLTANRGQVKGLGKAAVQKILKDHKIERVLAEEGGRTSRGSVGTMRKYVALLNELHEAKEADLNTIEEWWISKAKGFFAGKPFVLRFDSSKSTRFIIKDLLQQAEKRQAEFPGSTFVGTMLQHLVGAKLSVLLGGGIDHHGASVADEPSGRNADFLIKDVAIHVTTSPTEAVIRKCRRNLDAGLRPIIISSLEGLAVAEGLAKQAAIINRLDVFDVEQFLAGNLYELGKFALEGRRATAEQIISEYNKIIDLCETDPSLRIDIAS